MTNHPALAPDGTRKIQLSSAQFHDVENVLRDLFERTKCPAAALVDSSGLLIAQCGSVNQNALLLLATLAAANYAATHEMAKLIGETNGFKIHFHEGEKTNIYIAGVSADYSLIVVFNQLTTFGMVRVLTAKAAEGLQKIVDREPANGSSAEPSLSLKNNAAGNGFRDELSSRLDAVMQPAASRSKTTES